MKCIRRGKYKGKADHNVYRYFDIPTRQDKYIKKEDLYELGASLPLKVKKALRKIELFKVPMTQSEESDALTLCSISIGCFKGSPRMNIDGVSMDDYTNEFYINMVKCLKSWAPEKGPWPCYVKWVRLKTVSSILKRVCDDRKGEAEARRSGLLNNFAEIDFGSLQELGLTVSEGSKVTSA